MRLQFLLMLLPVICTLTLLVAFATYVFLQAPRKYYLKLVLIPASLFSGVLLVLLFVWALGYAYPHALPETFQFLGRNYVVVDGKKKWIEVWTKTDRARLYLIPWSKKTEDQMEKAMRAGKGGGIVIMKRGKEREKEGRPREDHEYDDYESNLELPENDNVKTQ